ncbi:hypothetical protein [Enterococcus sp. AZ163]|uniref:hypothetical protein n=1 Tax=Enterococcus sp. AZ163 TaxID=2774638 RepID=UPI003D2794D9
MTENKKQALKDFDREVDYIESDEIDIDDRFVNLLEIDLYDFGESYKKDSDMDIDDLIDDSAEVIKNQYWVLNGEGYAERACHEKVN